MQHWIDMMAEDIHAMLEAADVDISFELEAFLYNEYVNVGKKLAVPLTLQELAQKKLPEKKFKVQLHQRPNDIVGEITIEEGDTDVALDDTGWHADYTKWE